MNYILDSNGNRIEGLSKEEIYAVLQQAIDDGDLENIDADSAFVSKIKCCVGGGTYKMAFVTQAVYNNLQSLGQLEVNTYYFITDDNSYNNIVTILNGLLDGTVQAKEAIVADYASEDTSKGTIEQRLTNLGFRQGSVTLADGVTATLNELKRQGNYVIGKVYVNRTGVLGTIPENFRPKENMTFGIIQAETIQNGTDPHGYSWDATFTKYCSINVNGEISLTESVILNSGNMERVFFTNSLPYQINFGYEANPIE